LLRKKNGNVIWSARVSPSEQLIECRSNPGNAKTNTKKGDQRKGTSINRAQVGFEESTNWRKRRNPPDLQNRKGVPVMKRAELLYGTSLSTLASWTSCQRRVPKEKPVTEMKGNLA